MRIEIENLKKTYQGIEVLNIEKLAVRDGKITAIVGPNGAGKSTLLNLIGNLLEKDEGVIRYDGDKKVPEKNINPCIPGALSDLHHRQKKYSLSDETQKYFKRSDRSQNPGTVKRVKSE